LVKLIARREFRDLLALNVSPQPTAFNVELTRTLSQPVLGRTIVIFGWVRYGFITVPRSGNRRGCNQSFRL